MSRRPQRRKGTGALLQNFLAGGMRRFECLAHYTAAIGFVLGEITMRYKSAFAVPSGFAVATRTATKGKTVAVQDAAQTPAGSATGRSRQTSAGVAPVRAA